MDKISSREYSELVKKGVLLDMIVKLWKDDPHNCFELMNKLSGVEPLKHEPERRNMTIITIEPEIGEQK